ncbi:MULTISPECIES: peroxide-responsive transcriptional repressor PerR [Exiguobacterium]|uniref:peroxide-responsive transcriptional repressor PerR n=2 Tax=Bacillales Family XII. Incertae Sedis TaxID=539742 RepID=UPI0020373AF7|nr:MULTISPECIES: peroxide-responsive transcriptional repressor PerR [Exiguobacterium]
MDVANEMLDDAVRSLRDSGVRMTPQRHAILEYLTTGHTHPTADDIYRALEHRFPNMSVATVYNNLRVFREKGIVEEMNYGDASSRFDFVTTRHYHMICEGCGKIVDFNYPVLDDVETVAAHLTGFKVDRHRLEVYGTCPECQSNVQ